MLYGAGARRKARQFFSGAARLCRDRRGVAAIEFAFLAPILLGMYFVTMEVSQAIETNKKVSRIASMVADLVTQKAEVTPDEVKAIMNIGISSLQPYNRSDLTITVSGIAIAPLEEGATEPSVKVAWSRKMTGTVDGPGTGAGIAAGQTTTVPESLKTPGSYLIRVRTELPYRPVITWAAAGKPVMGLSAAFDVISMSETYYLKGRVTPRVDCPTCTS